MPSTRSPSHSSYPQSGIQLLPYWASYSTPLFYFYCTGSEYLGIFTLRAFGTHVYTNHADRMRYGLLVAYLKQGPKLLDPTASAVSYQLTSTGKVHM